jgi:uncharacterized protein (DUF1810 family)
MQAINDLTRFIEAQTPIYATVLAELRAGRKRSHWMWFIFPQIAGLGLSPTSRFYAIAGLAEARAYLADETLGSRLVECTQAALLHPARGATEIFGPIDAAKFRSSMTLFARADPKAECFPAALQIFFEGRADEATLGILGAS